MVEMPLVLREDRDRVATLYLNRPDRSNAWTPELERELYATLDALVGDDTIGAVVLTGAGRAFCGGADMDWLASADSESEPSSHSFLWPLSFPKPLIAAVNGACAGLGFQVALMCDVRFVAAEAKLTTAFARRGLIAEHGLSWLMPQMFGLPVALDLLLSARVFTGVEAQELGVAHRAVPRESLLENAYEYARDLAHNVSPTAMAIIKWQLYNHPRMDFLASVDHSDELMNESFERADLSEGIASFVEKRSPAFGPLDFAAVPAAQGDLFDRIRNVTKEPVSNV